MSEDTGVPGSAVNMRYTWICQDIQMHLATGTTPAHKKKDKWKQINTFYMDCPVIKKWRVQIPLTDLALSNVCTFPKQGPGLPTSYVVVFLCSASSVKMRRTSYVRGHMNSHVDNYSSVKYRFLINAYNNLYE